MSKDWTNRKFLHGQPIIVSLNDPGEMHFYDDGGDDGGDDDDSDWDNDDDIACPLFYRLQEFFRMEFETTADEALDLARTFMRDYYRSHKTHEPKIIARD